MHYYAHFYVFFFNDTATTEIYTLSLHDALPISRHRVEHELRQDHVGEQPVVGVLPRGLRRDPRERDGNDPLCHERSEEHTSELQSRLHLVCRLLLEKKKTVPHEYNRESTEVQAH